MTTKAKRAKAGPSKRTSPLADYMRGRGVDPKVGRAKLRREGVPRVLNDEAIAALSAWPLQYAKNHFSAVVEEARLAPQIVTKHGKPAVVIVAAEEYARLRQLEKLNVPSFVDLLLAMPKDDGSFERMEGELLDVEF